MENTPDRSCDVEIGKSSFNEVCEIQEKVKKEIDELLDSADPYSLDIQDSMTKESPIEEIERKCDIVLTHFQKLAVINKYKPIAENKCEITTSTVSAKRKILLKFTDNTKEDEIFNKELAEIPEKLQEEILHCKQVIQNLLRKNFPIPEQKLLDYLEILYECNLLKIHSDPVCLFIQDKESTALFEGIIKYTRVSNTLKTYILRMFS